MLWLNFDIIFNVSFSRFLRAWGENEAQWNESKLSGLTWTAVRSGSPCSLRLSPTACLPGVVSSPHIYSDRAAQTVSACLRSAQHSKQPPSVDIFLPSQNLPRPKNIPFWRSRPFRTESYTKSDNLNGLLVGGLRLFVTSERPSPDPWVGRGDSDPQPRAWTFKRWPARRERGLRGATGQIQNIEVLIYFHHLGNFLISILFPFLISKS